MVAKLTVVFLIILLLQLGVLLVLMPWVSLGSFGNWNENFLLAFVSEKTGLTGLRAVVSSGWVKGAVTGLGVLNILIAFLEMANFKKSVAALEGDKSE